MWGTETLDETRPATLTSEESEQKTMVTVSNKTMVIAICAIAAAAILIPAVAYCVKRKCASGKKDAQASEIGISKVSTNDTLASPDKRHRRDNSSAQFINDSSRGTFESSSRNFDESSRGSIDMSQFNSTQKLKPSDPVDDTKA